MSALAINCCISLPCLPHPTPRTDPHVPSSHPQSSKASAFHGVSVNSQSVKVRFYPKGLGFRLMGVAHVARSAG